MVLPFNLEGVGFSVTQKHKPFSKVKNEFSEWKKVSSFLCFTGSARLDYTEAIDSKYYKGKEERNISEL